MEQQKLLDKIEQLREEIEVLAEEKGQFNDEQVIEKSKELDKALNQYNRLAYKGCNLN